MTANHKLLVAIDGSAGTRRALDYVSALSRSERDVQITLFHAADPLPPRLREFPGAENPQKEERLETELQRKQDRWTERSVDAADALLDKARLTLERSGVRSEMIEIQTVSLLHREDLIDEILKAAHQNRCDTVVVGRNSFPWLKEILSSHVGEKLAEKAQGLNVRVID